MNSRRKGKVGEREFASLLREHGFDARRGQQFCGGVESPDVVSEALAWLHFEVKRVQNLNLADACIQAQCDSGGKPWVVAHRRNHAPWFITMKAEFFFELIREFEPQRNAKSAEVSTPAATSSVLGQPSPVASRHPLPSDGRGAPPQSGEGASRTGDPKTISAATCVAANNEQQNQKETTTKLAAL